MKWIINIDICSWTWIWSLGLLIAWSIITAVEWRLNCFIHDNFVLDIILFLFMIILTGAWIDSKCLSSIRSFTFMLPEFTSLGFEQKGLWFLAYKLPIWVHSLVFVGFLFNWDNSFVWAWSWSSSFFFRIFTVWYFRLESCIFTSRIELFLTEFLVIIVAWTRIFVPSLSIMDLFMVFEKFSLNLTLGEIMYRCLWLNCRYFWVITSWTNFIKTFMCISSCSEFFSWNTGSLCMRNDSKILMLFSSVFQYCFIKIFQIFPLRSWVIMAWIRILLISWTSY